MTRALDESDRAMLLQLIETVRARGAQKPDSLDAVDYDWTRPCRFTHAGLRKLNDFAQQAAEQVSRGLGAKLREDVRFEPEPVAQYYAPALLKAAEGAVQYSIALAQQGASPCGAIAFPQAAAIAWVQKLLGSAGDEASTDRELSSLETALLLDLAGTIAEAFSATAQAAGGPALVPSGQVIKGNYPLPQGQALEFCKIAFRQAGDGGAEVALVILSDRLLPVAGAQVSRQTGPSQADQRQHVRGHLDRVAVRAEAWLGTAQVAMCDVMALAPGDVLLLERKVDEPIGLSVQGNVVLQGFPVACDGRNALKVVRPAGG